MPTPDTGSNLSHTSIHVNFQVEITGDSTISIFSKPADSVSNFIVAEVGLPVNALYDEDANIGLIELWEPSDDPGDIKAQLANQNTEPTGGKNLTGAYKETCSWPTTRPMWCI